MFTNGILTYVEQLYQSTLNDPGFKNAYGSIESTFRLIAGIGALVFIFSRMIGQIVRVEPIDFFPYLRPFMLVGFIAIAPSLCDVIDDFGLKLWNKNNTRNQQIYASIQRLETKVQDALKRKRTLQANNPTLKPANTLVGAAAVGAWIVDGISALGDTLADKFSEWADYLKAWLLSLIQDLLMVLLQVAEACVYLLSISFRLVLRLAAPFAIVASIFPGMQSSFTEWLGKYINFTLMPFIASIVGSICYAISESYLNSYIATLTSYSSVGKENADPTLMGIAYIGVLIVCLLLFFQVPSLTNLFVSVGGVGGLMAASSGRLTSMGKSAAGKGLQAGKVAGAGGYIAARAAGRGAMNAGRAGFNYLRGG